MNDELENLRKRVEILEKERSAIEAAVDSAECPNAELCNTLVDRVKVVVYSYINRRKMVELYKAEDRGEIISVGRK